ncbi:MAG: hypothetical protein ACE5GL_01375, partial [Calditrichia bacterium]
EPLTAENWPKLKQMAIETLKLSGIEVVRKNNDLEFTADGRQYKIEPRNFKLLIPKGGLKGYESH